MVWTNADLYTHALAELERHQPSERSLRDFLAAFAALIAERRNEAGVTPEVLVHMVGTAFTRPVGSIDDYRRHLGYEPSTVDEVIGLLARQIDDLDEMHQTGTLDDEWRYFGINAPSGERWYNFDPHTYVECGLVGAFDAYEPDAGSLVELPLLTWADLGRFVICGQIYE